MSHRARLIFAAVLTAIFTMLINPASASAHAVMVASAPGGWQFLDSSPSEVSLRFTEPVDVGLANIKLINPRGKEVTGLGAPQHPDGKPDSVSVRIPETLANGTYTVAWRVVSADTHPVQGAFTFSVREATAPGDASAAQESDGLTGVLYGVARWLATIGFVLFVGTVFLIAVCWPAARSRRGVRGLAVSGLATAALGSVAAVLFYGPYATGTSLADVVDGDVIGAALDSRIGIGLAVRVVLLVVASGVLLLFLRRDSVTTTATATATAIASVKAKVKVAAGVGASGSGIGTGTGTGTGSGDLDDGVDIDQDVDDHFTGVVEGDLPARQRVRRGVFVALGAGVLASTWSLVAHASVDGGFAPLSVLIGLIHLTATAVWLGGLPALGLLLRSGDLTAMRAAIPRFSAIAGWCVAVIAVTGLYQAWRQVGSVSALVSTTYGWWLMGKLVLVAVLLATGAFARRWVRKHYEFEIISVTDKRRAKRGPEPTEVGRFGRMLTAEMALAVVLLGVTASLAGVEPARAEQDRVRNPPQAGATEGPLSLAIPFDAGGFSGKGQLGLVFTPAKVGHNELHIAVLDAVGKPKQVPEMRAELRLAEAGIGPISVPLVNAGEAHYTAPNIGLPMAGRWELALTVRTSSIDQTTVRVPVNTK